MHNRAIRDIADNGRSPENLLYISLALFSIRNLPWLLISLQYKSAKKAPEPTSAREPLDAPPWIDPDGAGECGDGEGVQPAPRGGQVQQPAGHQAPPQGQESRTQHHRLEGKWDLAALQCYTSFYFPLDLKIFEYQGTKCDWSLKEDGGLKSRNTVPKNQN